MNITTKEVHRTPPEHVKLAGDRVLHVLDVEGLEVRVIVTAKGLGFSMEVNTVDPVVASAVMGHVALNPMAN